MKFKGITKLGQNYLAKCLAENKPVVFSKVEIGAGKITEKDKPIDFTSLKDLKKEVGVLSKNQIDNKVRLEIEITNDEQIEGFHPREIGIYINDSGQDKLYCYINEEDHCSYLPPASEAPVKFKYGVNFLVTSEESTILNWNGKELWVDKEHLKVELAKKEPIFAKKSGFNLEKSDNYNLNNSNILLTTKGAKDLLNNLLNGAGAQYDTLKELQDAIKNNDVDIAELLTTLATKEPKFSKNTAFNKNKTDSYNVNDSNLLVTAKALYNLFRNISDSVSSTSSTIFASLRAVKTAYDRGTQAYNLANTKEPKITKKSGFNLEKSDNYNLNNPNILLTTKGAKDLLNNLLNGAGAQYDTLKELQDAIKNNDVDIAELLTTLATKEPKFSKHSAFNKNFGISSGTVMEGKRLAETLGIPYGGILNNSNSKVAGTAYYDNTTKKTYKCTSTTSLNYAESTKFEAISNNDLLLKFQNLSKKKLLYQGKDKTTGSLPTNTKLSIEDYNNFSFISCEIQGHDGADGWKTTFLTIPTIAIRLNETYIISQYHRTENSVELKFISNTSIQISYQSGDGCLYKIYGLH